MVFPRRCSRRYWPVPSYSHFESAHLSGPSGSKAALHIATKKHRPLLLSWNHRNKGEQLATLVNRGPIAPRILLIFARLQHAPTHSRGIIASFFRGRGKGVILPLEYLSYYHYISMYISISHHFPQTYLWCWDFLRQQFLPLVLNSLRQEQSIPTSQDIHQ